MNEVQANPGYAAGQMARAFTTALSHEDADARRRAEERLARWRRVLDGMGDGSLSVGSRTPVAGLPAWVTLEVLRGGFATGAAAAGGDLLDFEADAARRAGLPAGRAALFRHMLTDEGVRGLWERLDDGRYEIVLPEESALLVVAWLLRAGDRAGALEVLEEIGPFADRLRFVPRPGAQPADASLVHREPVGEIRNRLGRRRPNAAVETMNEALAVWNPFADELLEHWLETVRDGRVRAVEPDGWRERGAALLDRYERLAAEHTRCTKHRRPKENAAILRTSLADVLAGREPSRLLRHAIASMVARRGTPGSAEHAALRGRQAADAARAPYHAIAQVVLARLADEPDGAGVPAVEPFVRPVTADEARRTGVAEGTEVPDWLRDTVEAALEAPVTTLMERGVVPSAEVLAALVPQLTAAATSEAYADPALQRVMAATYRAFRNRRSLLLTNLESQVRPHELPWVRAAERHRDAGATAPRVRGVLTRVAELALQGFPGTILPNPLIAELRTLAERSGLDVPFVEELAADIFMGRFSDKFARAARQAGELLDGTLYARYYGIDYRSLDAQSFGDLCKRRAGGRGGWSVAANGSIIEQAQILTTHNLALLVHPVGADPLDGWDGLARRAFGIACRLVRKVHGNPRPLGTIKDAAYAWRQAVFFLALCGLKEQVAVVAWMQGELDRQPPSTVRRLDPVLAGLRHVLTGGGLDTAPPPGTRRLLAWSATGHWMRHA
ncbi:transcriptional regulator [Actinomadura sediminis]|uniref:Transcriptional regulator n=1 Tax=Actinomadura sediminis TaxID=1038904 RepID=A0ABW3EIQ0_9ACTN